MPAQHHRPGRTARESRRARIAEAVERRARIRVHHGGYARCEVSLGRLIMWADGGCEYGRVDVRAVL